MQGIARLPKEGIGCALLPQHGCAEMRGIAQRRKKQGGQRQGGTRGCKCPRLAPSRLKPPGRRPRLRYDEAPSPTSKELLLEVSACRPEPDDGETGIQQIARPSLEARL